MSTLKHLQRQVDAALFNFVFGVRAVPVPHTEVSTSYSGLGLCHPSGSVNTGLVRDVVKLNTR